MHVLITGASGFIGSHLTHALLRQGHRVTAAVRNTAAVANRFPGIRILPVDFTQAHHPEDWLAHLEGVDGVINAVGIIRETGHQTFHSLHAQAPIALFQACVKTGIRRVIQISALGADDQAQSQYHLTKRTADDFLATTPLDWTILRPSIVYGPGATSMALFKALAALPLTPLVNRGEQLIQPIHVADLTTAVLRTLTPEGPNHARIDLVGPEPVSFSALMQRLRYWLGLGALRLATLPYGLTLAAAKLGGFLGTAPVTPETITMLRRGNTGSVDGFTEHFGFLPRSLDEALQAEPAHQSEKWHAGLFFLRPLLRLSIALVWISAGIVSAFIYPREESFTLLSQVGITGIWAPLSLYGAASLDLLLGVATLTGRWLRIAAYGQILIMTLYTVIITLSLPELWTHPFGPVVKNLPLLVATLIMLVLERKTTWNT
ncbi:MAG: NAD(P)H-binding protein [Gammaproteobacteria bacterium]|nr:NAD(P)H-binding protein [Gammaproteobacteria bacterium]